MSTIVPIANRAVLFETTERSWHGFSQIRLPPDRLHLSQNPSQFITTRRNVPRRRPPIPTEPSMCRGPSPSTSTPGILFGRRCLRAAGLVAAPECAVAFPLKTRMEFAETLAKITNSPSFRLGRMLTWPYRALMRRGPRRWSQSVNLEGAATTLAESPCWESQVVGGRRGDRTPDLCIANAALSQLS